MDLRQVTRSVQEQLATTAAVADEPTRRAAELLSVSLDPAVRLALQDAIGQVAAEVSAEIAPGRVDLTLRGGELEIRVVPPAAATADAMPAPPGPPMPPGPPATPAPPAPPAPGVPAPSAAEEPEAGSSRVSFRPPQHLKSRLEQAAEAEGLSMNAYLVRALTAHLEAPHGPDPSASPRSHTDTRHGAGRTSGWYI